MRLRDSLDLVARLAEADIEHLLATPNSLEQKLESHGGLAHARVSLYQIEAVFGKATAEDIVQSFDSGWSAISAPFFSFHRCVSDNAKAASIDVAWGALQVYFDPILSSFVAFGPAQN
jgi:hypothetical protein